MSYDLAWLGQVPVRVNTKQYKTMQKVGVSLMFVGLSVLLVAIVLLISTAALVREFVIRSEVSAEVTDLPKTAVVFTGQYDRTELALQLFDQGRLDRIFISGVNGGAGMSVKNFAQQFRLSPKARAALETGQIILSPDANTTIENALETSCWLNRQSDVREIVLITSRLHMPRASWALESALTSNVRVHRLSPEAPPGDDGGDGGDGGDDRLDFNMLEHMQAYIQKHTHNRNKRYTRELLKFGATVPLALIPRDWWSGKRPKVCP